MNTGFLWINTPSSSTHSFLLSCARWGDTKLPSCIPCPFGWTKGSMCCGGLHKASQRLQGCVKITFSSLEKLFWIFLLEAASNFHSIYWQINTFEMSNLLSDMTEVCSKLGGRRWMDQPIFWLHKLHFCSKAKINVGCSFLTLPLHKNLMGQSSTQPVDNQKIDTGKSSVLFFFLSLAQEDLVLPILSGCPWWVGKHRVSLDTMLCTGRFQKRTACEIQKLECAHTQSCRNSRKKVWSAL